MTTVVLVVHLMIAAALVGVVLMQRSEGGALGIGGGGGGGGFLSGRGTANLLTRATAVLAACFFATSITLTLLAQRPVAGPSILDNVPVPAKSAPSGPSVPSDKGAPAAPAQGGGGVLDKLKQGEGFSPLPPVPQNR